MNTLKIIFIKNYYTVKNYFLKRTKNGEFPIFKLDTFLLLTLIVTVLLLNSCNHSTLPEPIIEDGSYGIVPLRVGNSWEYKKYNLRKDGSILREGNRIRYKIISTSYDPSHKIQDPVYNISTEWLDTTYSSIWQQDPQVSFFRNYNEGLYIMGGKEPAMGGDTANTIYIKILNLKYPVNKGEKWRSPMSHAFQLRLSEQSLLNDTTTYSCIETNAKFETPLGIFSCIVYYHRFRLKTGEDEVGPYDIYEYYSENVGLVAVITNKYDDYYKQSYPLYKQVLISANVINNKN